MTEPTVEISNQAIAYLCAGALNHLWHTEKCCPQCCVQCAALKELHDKDQLDRLYGVYIDECGADHESWDADNRQVNRTWLAEAWSATDCHTEDGGTDEA